MMKTTLATVAIAAAFVTTEATYYQSPIAPSDISTHTKCDQSLVAMGNHNKGWSTPPLGFLVDLTGLGEDELTRKTNLDDCVAALKATVVPDQAKAGVCFTSTSSPEYAEGASNACPLPYGERCTPETAGPVAAAQVCQNKDGSGVDCGAHKVCLYDVVPTKALELTATFESHYSKVPTKISELINLAKNSLKCEEVNYQSYYTYPTNKKGTQYVYGRAVNSECDPAGLKTAIDSVIKTYNADTENAKKFEASYEAKIVDFPANCFDPTDASVMCKTTTGCTLPCPDYQLCTSDANCGSTWCRKPIKGSIKASVNVGEFRTEVGDSDFEHVCMSNAVASVIAPVLAVALAVAFF